MEGRCCKCEAGSHGRVQPLQLHYPGRSLPRVVWERHLLILAVARSHPMFIPGEKRMLAQQGISAQLFSCSCMWQEAGTLLGALRVSAAQHMCEQCVFWLGCAALRILQQSSVLCLLKPRECADHYSRWTSRCPLGSPPNNQDRMFFPWLQLNAVRSCRSYSSTESSGRVSLGNLYNLVVSPCSHASKAGYILFAFTFTTIYILV